MKITLQFYSIIVLLFAVFVLIPFSHCRPDNPPGKPVQYRLRQIMMDAVISKEHEAEIKTKAAAVLKKAQSGSDFTALAKAFSQEPGAQRTGGDLGFFTHSQMLKTFSDAVFSMKSGEIRGLVKTQYGFHIIKLHAIRGDKRHAQHILFMLTPGRADSLKVLETLGTVRKKILAGAKFDTMLSQYNTIKTLSDTDGYMVWQKPGDMLQSFARATKGLDEGDVSKPFISIIGFHIVMVDSINYNPDKLLTGLPAYIEKRMIKCKM